eukprot:13852718-Ditylum_brightwellii.AAC.1
MEEAAIDKRGAMFLSSEVDILTTQVCPSSSLLFHRAFTLNILCHTEANVERGVIAVGEGFSLPAIQHSFLSMIGHKKMVYLVYLVYLGTIVGVVGDINFCWNYVAEDVRSWAARDLAMTLPQL